MYWWGWGCVIHFILITANYFIYWNMPYCFSKKNSSWPGSRVCSRISFNFQLPVFTKTQSRWRNNAVQLLVVALKKQILTVVFLNNPYNYNKKHRTVNTGCSPITQSAQYVLLPDHCSSELCVAQCNAAQCSVAQFMVADWSVWQRTVGYCSEAWCSVAKCNVAECSVALCIVVYCSAV